MRKNHRKNPWPLRALLAALFIGLLFPATALAAIEPQQFNLGGRSIKLSGPAGHHWVDKNSILALKLAPARYENVVKHMISIYAREAGLSLSRPYHNYGALFFVGPQDKVWTETEFAELKARLMPGQTVGNQAELEQRYEFLRQFLRQGVGFKVSRGKAKKYYERVQKASVLRDTPHSLALSLLQQKKQGKGQAGDHVPEPGAGQAGGHALLPGGPRPDGHGPLPPADPGLAGRAPAGQRLTFHSKTKPVSGEAGFSLTTKP